jgi:excisionase family DNA binding protein
MANYLTIEEAAEKIRMPYETLRRKIKEGLVKAYKPGKRVLIDERELELFVKRSMVEAS